MQADAPVEISLDKTRIATGVLGHITRTHQYIQAYVLDQAEKLYTPISISYARRSAKQLAEEICTLCGISTISVAIPAQVLRNFHVYETPGHRALQLLFDALQAYGQDMQEYRIFCDADDILHIEKTPLQGSSIRLQTGENILKRYDDRILVLPQKVIARQSQPISIDGKSSHVARSHLIYTVDTHKLFLYPDGAAQLNREAMAPRLQLAVVRAVDAQQGSLKAELLTPGSLEKTGFFCDALVVSQQWAESKSAYSLPGVGSFVLIGYIDDNPGFPVVLQCFGSKDAYELTDGTASLSLDANQNLFGFKTAAASLKDILSQILDVFLQIGTVGSPTKQFIDPSTVTPSITELQGKIGGLFYE